jgi:membrane-bound lytic murein transglycosylase MltF
MEQGMEFVDRYIRNNDESLIKVRKRSQTPFAIIDSVLTQYKLPLELKYLAVIESELKPTALSRVGAKGPWQLMPETAHDLGLKVNRKADERINFYKSTRAAAKYLRDLHREFGDWLLVLAAYNGGPVPVYRAIHKSHSRNFWTLQRYLPAESRWHVKKFIATAYYFEAEGYGVTGPVMQKAAPVNPVSPVGFPESVNDRFHRLMEESARSLRTSKEILEN